MKTYKDKSNDNYKKTNRLFGCRKKCYIKKFDWIKKINNNNDIKCTLTPRNILRY